MLALLPLDPVGARPGRAHPVVEGDAQLGLAPEPGRERNLVQLDFEPLAQQLQLPQLVELSVPLEPIAGGGAPGDDEADGLQVPEHPGRPAGLGGRVRDRESLHEPTLPRVCEGFQPPI